jgi:hypothetical protein
LESSIPESIADCEIFLHSVHPVVFLYPVRKSVSRPQEYKFPGWGMQSWKFCVKLAEGRKYPGNLAEDSLITKVSNM